MICWHLSGVQADVNGKGDVLCVMMLQDKSFFSVSVPSMFSLMVYLRLAGALSLFVEIFQYLCRCLKTLQLAFVKNWL